MKLKQVKCLSCGSSIDYNPTTDRQKCDSCRSVFLLEKEEAPDNIYIFNQEIPLTEKQETMVELDQLLVHLWQLIALIDVKDEATHLSKYSALETILQIRKKLFNY